MFVPRVIVPFVMAEAASVGAHAAAAAEKSATQATSVASAEAVDWHPETWGISNSQQDQREADRLHIDLGSAASHAARTAMNRILENDLDPKYRELQAKQDADYNFDPEGDKRDAATVPNIAIVKPIRTGSLEICGPYLLQAQIVVNQRQQGAAPAIRRLFPKGVCNGVRISIAIIEREPIVWRSE